MWNIAICDDDHLMITEVSALIDNNFPGMFRNEEVYKDGISLISDIEEDRFDANIVFLDIQIGDYNGIELSKKILHRSPTTQIIFMSGYDDYYQDVYEVEHVFFLQKPLKKEAFVRALVRADEKLKKIKKRSLCISNRGRIDLVPFDDICTIEKDRRKVIINTQTGENYSMYAKMCDIIDMLGPEFERCHNSFIVNFEKVKTLEKDVFKMCNGEEISISRTYLQHVREEFAKYIDENYIR